MKYILKLLLLIYIIALFILQGGIPYGEVLVLVLIMGVNVFKERFYDNVYTTIVSLLIICYGIWLDRNFAFLLAVPVFDFIYQKKYLGVPPTLLAALYLSAYTILPSILFIICLSGILAFFMEKASEKELAYKTRLDDERRLRYELEQTKAKLLHSSKEIAHLTEVGERNRIAREIHDNVGHSIAGILIQLQAANKLYDRDQLKSKEIVEKSIVSLSDALTLLRNTVYNIKPHETLGIEYIKNVISDFGFCPVDFQFHGDFNLLSSNHLEIMGSTIKEGLTNTARHSKATQVNIKIDINEKYTRLFVKDNGIGCDKYKEGLGISGMKERIHYGHSNIH